jgi:N-acetylmuramoyl-L-alanine amidase
MISFVKSAFSTKNKEIRFLLNPKFFPLILCLLAVPALLWANPLILIDAAHGGSDSGVIAGKEQEKDWDLKFALSLKAAFSQAGFDVVLSRDSDATLDPDKRAQTINTSGAAAVLVLHADKETSGVVQGPFFVVEPPNHPDLAEGAEVRRWGLVTISQYRSSLRLARALASALGVGPDFSALSDSRGLLGESGTASGRILCSPEQSLRNLTLPAVDVLPLFLTNTSDLKKFSDSASIAAFNAKLVRGVSEYLRLSNE